MNLKGKGIEKTFPNAGHELIKLLKGLLEFNPFMRLTAAEALKSPVFDKIRVPYFERPSPVQIKQAIHDPETFRYDD